MDTAPFTLEITQDAPAVFHAPSCSGSLDLRLGDCMEGMRTFPDGHFDLAIVDPPYGIGWDGENDTMSAAKQTISPKPKIILTETAYCAIIPTCKLMTHQQFSQKGGKAKSPAKKLACQASLAKAREKLSEQRKKTQQMERK